MPTKTVSARNLSASLNSSCRPRPIPLMPPCLRPPLSARALNVVQGPSQDGWGIGLVMLGCPIHLPSVSTPPLQNLITHNQYFTGFFFFGPIFVWLLFPNRPKALSLSSTVHHCLLILVLPCLLHMGQLHQSLSLAKAKRLSSRCPT